MRLTLLAPLALLAACSTAPELDDRISDEAREADFPTLIALDGPALGDAGTGTGGDVIDELDSRTANLWARIGALF